MVYVARNCFFHLFSIRFVYFFAIARRISEWFELFFSFHCFSFRVVPRCWVDLRFECGTNAENMFFFSLATFAKAHTNNIIYAHRMEFLWRNSFLRETMNNRNSFDGDDQSQPSSTHNCALISVANVRAPWFLLIIYFIPVSWRMWPIKVTEAVSPQQLSHIPMLRHFWLAFCSEKTKETGVAHTRRRKKI